jgi:hypothetical protein
MPALRIQRIERVERMRQSKVRATASPGPASVIGFCPEIQIVGLDPPPLSGEERLLFLPEGPLGQKDSCLNAPAANLLCKKTLEGRNSLPAVEGVCPCAEVFRPLRGESMPPGPSIFLDSPPSHESLFCPEHCSLLTSLCAIVSVDVGLRIRHGAFDRQAVLLIIDKPAL